MFTRWQPLFLTVMISLSLTEPGFGDPLHRAAIKDDLPRMQRLVEQGADVEPLTTEAALRCITRSSTTTFPLYVF